MNSTRIIYVTVSTFLHSPHPVNQSSRLVVQGVHRLPPTHQSSGSPHRRQMKPHPMHMGGYVFVASLMHRRPPPKCPIKGCILTSAVSQSLALKLSTSQNFSCDQHPGLCRSVVPALMSNALHLFIISLFASLLPYHSPYHYRRVAGPKHD